MIIENEFESLRYLHVVCKILDTCKDKKLNVLELWKCHEQFYLKLRIIARTYLAVPVHLSPERVFSLCGNVVENYRKTD